MGRMTMLATVELLLLVVATPAVAGPNRCGTKPPDRSPTWTDGLGRHWFDSQGVWTQGPDGFIWGYGGVDFDSRSVQVDPTTDHSDQVYLSPSEQSATVSGDGNALNIGEYPVQPAERRSFRPSCRGRSRTNAPSSPSVLA